MPAYHVTSLLRNQNDSILRADNYEHAVRKAVDVLHILPIITGPEWTTTTRPFIRAVEIEDAFRNPIGTLNFRYFVVWGERGNGPAPIDIVIVSSVRDPQENRNEDTDV